MEMVWTKKDQLHIEIPIKVPEYQLHDGSVTTNIPLEFLIVRRRDIKAAEEQFKHLKNFVAIINARNFQPAAAGDKNNKNSLVVMSESDEAVNHLLNV